MTAFFSFFSFYLYFYRLRSTHPVLCKGDPLLLFFAFHVLEWLLVEGDCYGYGWSNRNALLHFHPRITHPLTRQHASVAPGYCEKQCPFPTIWWQPHLPCFFYKTICFSAPPHHHLLIRSLIRQLYRRRTQYLDRVLEWVLQEAMVVRGKR